MNHPFYFILFCHVLTASLSLSSPWQVRDKLKIKSTRKIIYKSTSQARAFYPYCSVRTPPSGEENRAFSPHNSPLLVWADCTPEPGRAGGSSGKQLKIKTLWSWNHLATLALPSLPPPGSPPAWGLC